jgi:YfiH family protein
MMDVIRITAWAQYEWLRHGFSTRAGGTSTVYTTPGSPGELNLGFTKADDPDAVRANRAAFQRAVEQGAAMDEMVTVRQVHAATIKAVAEGSRASGGGDVPVPEEADGLVSAARGAMLAIQVADCVPVLVADVEKRVVGAFHAGWRGTVAGIVGAGIGRMKAEFGCSDQDLVAAVGPSIGRCCYAVGDAVRTEFTGHFAYAGDLFEERDGLLYLDLWEANRRQLVDAGVREDRVAVVAECTGCTRVAGLPKFFSHRAEHGFTGRGMGAIGIVRQGIDGVVA